MSIRVILADDHLLVRDALRKLLEAEPDLDVVGTADTGRDALEITQELPVDVVVLDIGMPDLNGIEATARIVARHPETRVIALSTYSEKRFIVEMMKAGASGYVTKSSAATELIQAIHAVKKGERYLCTKATAEIIDSKVESDSASKSRPPLSHREREVLQLVAEGLRSSEIAERMHLAESTIEVHRRNIMQKLGLRNVAELTKYAIREGLTPL